MINNVIATVIVILTAWEICRQNFKDGSWFMELLPLSFLIIAGGITSILYAIWIK